ncbi:MAG: 50S ribosomal protein L11 methyltransferase [Oscillospiraceae bacterium]|nr:50S ribosomal protein L11 methyltransferase [Oscillospiraceae bacterium]
MQWLEITLHTLPGTTETVAAALTAAGFEDLVLEDQTELETFLDQNRAYWDYIDEQLQQQLQGLSQIKLYLEHSDTAAMTRLTALVEGLRAKGCLGELPLEVSSLAQTDWEESWKENYPPQYIGSRLAVLPYWLADTDIGGRLPVILDPGLTFGTGAHPSTRMVLEAMEELVAPGCTCLDLGSGSGILSIAALRLGAASAIGVDIDPKAEDIARQNAAYNGFSAPVFTALTGNVTTDRPLMARLQQHTYRVVLVNIVADVIISIAPVLPLLMDSGSTLILSGILDTRLEDVRRALEIAGLTVTSIRAGEDWRCVTAKRSEA